MGQNLKISWLSGRKIGSDLAATTELGLGESLRDRGNIIHLVSPEGKVAREFSEHSFFRRWDISGLQTFSGGYYARRLVRSCPKIGSSDAILVDWRLVGALRKTLQKMKIPWFIIDRGPPAYDGILAWIQKIFWKQSWKIAQSFASGGFVVSEGHREFVRKNAKLTDSLEISVIPAGTDIEGFSERKKKIEDELKMAYVGRVDRNRGIDGIEKLANRLREKGIHSTIYVAGEGDMKEQLTSIQGKDRGVEIQIIGKISRKQVRRLLEDCHIGIMPMPDKEIWRISSPLKLGEYAAAGLLTIGPDHIGNRIGSEESWSILMDGEWQIDCINRIIEIRDSGKWEEHAESARETAKSLDWSHIAKKMEDDIKRMGNINC